MTPLYSYQTKNQNHLGQFHIQPYHHFCMVHSSESFGLKLIYMRYFMPKIQQINLEIVNKLTFLDETSSFMTPGGPLWAGYVPLVVRFRLGHLRMTHGNSKSWYHQPEDHLEVVRKRNEKAPSEKGWFWGVLKKPPNMACMFLQCQDMVRTCYKS